MRKLLWMMAAQWLALAGHAQPWPYTPLFQFQVFYYTGDLEMSPNPAFAFSNRIHGNANLYLAPQVSLNLGPVTSAGAVYTSPSPLNPLVMLPGQVTFSTPPLTNIYPYALGADANLTNGYGALMLPPPGERLDTYPGASRFYNWADMIIIISNDNTIHVTSGAGIDNQATVVTDFAQFMGTNGSFYDMRDELTVNPTVLDISNLVVWSATNTEIRPVLAGARGWGGANV